MMDFKLLVVIFAGLLQRSCQTRIGCFRDDPAGSDLNGIVKTFITTNSPEMCEHYCTGLNYLYYAVGLGFNCYCGNRFGSQGAVSSSECNIPCPGGTGATCGGDTAAEVYMTGISKCYCSAIGDPHYKTFDDAMLHFQGVCTYILIDSTTMANPNCRYRVLGKNQPYIRNNRVATTKEVNVEMWSETATEPDVVKIGQGKTVTVNGVPYNGMVIRPNFEVITIGANVMVANDCGLEVYFDGQWTAKFYAPPTDAQFNSGICGTCNDQLDDEYMLKNGTDAIGLPDRTSLIGNSYWEPGINEPEKHCNRIEPEPVCADDIKAQIASDKSCGLMNKVDGPFKDCIPLTEELAKLYESCEYDVCVSWEDPTLAEEQVCTHLGSLQDQCNLEDIAQINFRTATFCPVDCGENMEYNPAITTIQPSCKTQDTAGKEYTGPAVAGCVCMAGFLYDDGNDRCVSAAQCGCVEGDNYFPIGDGYVSEDCSVKKVCVNEGGNVYLKDEPASCGANEQCTSVAAGIGVCDCIENFVRNDVGVCEEIDWCDINPCLNGGVCNNEPVPDLYSCDCPALWQGDHCETEIDLCNPNPCQNSGTCSKAGDSYECKCDPPFLGDHCDQVDPCPGDIEKKRCSSPKNGYRPCEVPAGKTVVGINIIKELSGSTGCEFHPNPAPADEDYVTDVTIGVYGFVDNFAWVTWGCRGRLEICYI